MKTEKEIIEGNKLIAEFINNSRDWNYLNSKLCIFESELKYHSSWDWLMPVVEKIEKIGETPERYGTLCTIDTNYIKIGKVLLDHKNKDYFSKIEGLYKAVVEFIKWYNKQD